MKTRGLFILLSWLLLPLVPHVADCEEEEEGGGIGLTKRLLPDDRELLPEADKLASASLEATGKVVTDSKGDAVLRSMKALLASKRLPIKTETELHGAWKVRSLQSSKLGAYSYPFFDCRIFHEAKALIFHKAQGSQRRLGFLERDSKDRFLFAGAMYFTYDPRPRTYKGASDKPAKEDLERNCVAWLYKIADDRLIMVFPSLKSEVEIYELKR